MIMSVALIPKKIIINTIIENGLATLILRTIIEIAAKTAKIITTVSIALPILT